jgi:hypothetical protein
MLTVSGHACVARVTAKTTRESWVFSIITATDEDEENPVNEFGESKRDR